MTDCCESSPKARRLNCPHCTAVSLSVGYQTLIHQLKHPYNLALSEQVYYFCDSSACDVVYFDSSAEVIGAEKLRAVVGQKSLSEDRPICYCFDISFACIQDELAASGICQSKVKVIEWTQRKLCHCEIRNPSGACCLVDFKRIEKAFKA
ncbi:MAG: hypothetical protein COB51_14465 [Moraxellaceae bacterium]|nr:MAG: hypothetical protein COB51_14465 [Moraxellaceae bacterium]